MGRENYELGPELVITDEAGLSGSLGSCSRATTAPPRALLDPKDCILVQAPFS
jgi:hypothetical protein